MLKRNPSFLGVWMSVPALLILWFLSSAGVSTPRASDKSRGGGASASITDGSGNLYLTGPSNEVLGEGQGYVTIKYDNGGKKLWGAPYLDPYDREDLTANIELGNCGNAYVRFTDDKDQELAVVCYSPDGDEMWRSTFGSPETVVSEDHAALSDLFRTAEGPSYEEGWPVILSGGTNQNVAAADIDNDGMVEIVVSEFIPPVSPGTGDGHIYIFRHDGTLMEPWPDVDLEPYGLNPRSVSVGDLDNDGDLEIVFAGGCTPETEGYTVYIFHHDGTKVTDGWPKAIGSFAPVSPILEDIDNDGLLEIIGKDGSDRISAWNFDGSDVPGWPFVCPGAGPINYLAAGDLNCDGHKEVVGVQSSLVHHYMYLISSDGKLSNSWYISDYSLNASAFPSLADLDKDGDLEILLYDCSMLHAYHHNGTYVDGWPVLAYEAYTGGRALSISDMDRDHRLEIAALTMRYYEDEGISLWRSDGSLVQGWPITMDQVVFNYPSAMGNIDTDDALEVLVTAWYRIGGQSQIFAFNWDGTIVDDFPFSVTDIRFGHVGNVVLCETDGDGGVEAIFAMQTASPTNLFMVGVLDLSAAYDSASLEWPMFGHDPRRTGRYFRGTIYVDDDNAGGPWYGTAEFPYEHVQDGIDNANPLDLVFVHNGSYDEDVTVDKAVYIVGQNKDSTIIDAVGGQAGVHLAADLVAIRGFTIRNSSGSGIYVGSSYNTVLRNNIIGNYYGVHVASPEGNRIYHNNFVGNQENARDDFLSTWDDGYPSGGNYWDDYSGSDLYWGPNQDVPGSDGIGDTIYVISGGSSQDRYPLMSPWTDSLPIPSRDTVYVDDDFDESTPGWGWVRFDKIQDALDTVASDGVVYVANGTYYENIRMDKTMDLIGENRDSTIIDGGGSGDVVVFNRIHGTNLSGFTIRNGVYGVHLGYDTFDNAVLDNIVTDNQEVGIFLDFSTSTAVSGNVITNTDYYGIHLQAAQGNVMSGNTLRANQIGIYSYVSSNDNQVYHNDFIDNDQNACDHGDNIWDNGYPSGGNYWSNFDQAGEGAYDNDGDGIIDTPYDVPCGGKQDRYPLMDPHHTALVSGDANRDWLIDIGDVVYVINYLYKGGPAPNPLWVGDVNCDETVDLGDVIYLLNHLFKGGPPPESYRSNSQP